MAVEFGDSDGDSDSLADVESVGEVDPLLLGNGDFDKASESDAVRDNVDV